MKALFWLGQIYYSQNRFDKTIKIYEKFLYECKSCKIKPVIFLKLGISYLKRGKKGKAVHILKNLVNEYPNSPEAKKAKNLLKILLESKMENIYNVPRHVAIIMDGNGRWAKKRGLPRVFGHRKGAKAVEDAIDFARDIGIEWLTVFAFSTENWERPKSEVNAIMSLLVEYINKKVPKLLERDIRLRFLGRIQELPEKIQRTVKKGEELTKNCTSMNLVVALNYSGRAEIVDAVRKIVEQNVKYIDEETFPEYLYIPEMPDPDLLIRTSGEKRISNFLLWELAYTELYFTEVLWPDFDEREFKNALLDYQSRERRFGKILEG